MKIKSQNDKEKLAEAKEQTYLKGFYEATMIVGEFAGRKVKEAKPLIRNKLLETGQAIIYSEPEKRVLSRSGDECVVALTDQWYITYEESEWKKLAEECLSSMSLYSDETRHGFEHTLSWLERWACSRSFGLGTRIPWDEQFLVESLSDSSIYMAYYTVSHHLQNGDMYGSSEAAIKPQQLTDDVWDYIFCGGPYAKSTDISSSLLDRMKQEFEYWYPFDLRVSGKDLIQNHLTFCIYSHTAIMAKHHWPRGFRCNGHISLNSEIMSKSTGNFRILCQAIEEFSADATRFSLADAGDGVDDANFVFETANAAILWLTKEIAWYEDNLAAESSMRTGPPSTYADRVFANEINIAVKTTEQNYSNYIIYLERAFEDGFVVNAGWPTADAPDLKLKSANKYLQDSIVLMRKTNLAEILELSLQTQRYWRLYKQSSLGQSSNFKQIQKLCMPFLRFKKEEAIALGAQALDLRLPFGEIEVLEENLDLIKRQIGLDDVEILSAADADSLARAGPLVSLLNQNPLSPGNPTAIFLTW
ncbi:Leucine--tRNA ligase [Spatholobus suberectus]|nr:Leucine--tRNA ligase [Spatholobus suberectus]